ncbi:hypothetical protein BZG02_02275 [Labilibaculum filiforme]|uniref:Uncharacterized protein n=1 Tax=Labilibaculum filiforme TaxID=1940526 RepID=A0A2N3I6C7_9BACT|nr:hypothetical protein [Labilibaculum filiforme]PKQ65851.1 hypothetical protein BZG02_02275 [Labilibaculum filiforme]
MGIRKKKDMRAMRVTIWGILILLGTISCSNSEEEMNMEMQITNSVNIEENAMVNCILEDILSEVEKNVIFADNNTNIASNTKQDSIPMIKISGDEKYRSSTKTISIDYGSNNQVDHLGRHKRGQIHNEITGRYLTNGTRQNIRFEDFCINDIKIEGKIEIISNGFNDYEQLSFTISYDSILLVSENGLKYSISGTKTKEWISGYDTPEDLWDDQFLIYGECHGINSENREYNSKISTPLLISRACEFILSGETEFQVETETIFYNFGDGMCDNKGYYTQNGEVTNFEFGRYSFRKRN